MFVVTRFILCICYVGSRKECQAEEDRIIDEESNQFDNYDYEGDDYECQDEETENLESNESEKLLDEKKEIMAKEKMRRLTTQETKIQRKQKGGNLKIRYVCLTRYILH